MKKRLVQCPQNGNLLGYLQCHLLPEITRERHHPASAYNDYCRDILLYLLSRLCTVIGLKIQTYYSPPDAQAKVFRNTPPVGIKGGGHRAGWACSDSRRAGVTGAGLPSGRKCADRCDDGPGWQARYAAPAPGTGLRQSMTSGMYRNRLTMATSPRRSILIIVGRIWSEPSKQMSTMARLISRHNTPNGLRCGVRGAGTTGPPCHPCS